MARRIESLLFSKCAELARSELSSLFALRSLRSIGVFNLCRPFSTGDLSVGDSLTVSKERAASPAEIHVRASLRVGPDTFKSSGNHRRRKELCQPSAVSTPDKGMSRRQPPFHSIPPCFVSIALFNYVRNFLRLDEHYACDRRELCESIGERLCALCFRFRRLERYWRVIRVIELVSG